MKVFQMLLLWHFLWAFEKSFSHWYKLYLTFLASSDSRQLYPIVAENDIHQKHFVTNYKLKQLKGVVQQEKNRCYMVIVTYAKVLI